MLNLPPTRAEAKESGSAWYFTGKPCKHGHVCKRRTNDGKCKECVKERDIARADYFKNWRQQNLDKSRSYSAAYRERNPEKCAEYMRSVRADDARREALLARERERYAENKSAHADKNRRHRKSNPEYFAAAARNRRALKRNAAGSHTQDDIKQLLGAQKHKCAYCGACCKKTYHVDHVVPLTLGGSNDRSNLQILCVSCNLKKSNKDPIKFAAQIGLLL